MTDSREELTQMLESEQKLLDRVRELGENSLNVIQSGVDWLSDQKRAIATCVATGAIAVGGTGVYETMDTMSATASTKPHTEVLHKRTDVNLQKLMDKIHNSLPTEDKKHYTGAIGPTSAWLKPSMGEFNTNCSNPYLGIPDKKYNYKFYEIFTSGVEWTPCKGLWIPGFAHAGSKPPYEESKQNEFKRDLDTIGNKVLEAVHIKSSQTTAEAKLNRSSGTITYNSSSSSSSTKINNVEKIVLNKQRGYTEATITLEK